MPVFFGKCLSICQKGYGSKCILETIQYYAQAHNIYIQWNLSNPTHQGIREMCRIVQDVGILKFYLC